MGCIFTNDGLFYWYQSYHWYQWTIGIPLTQLDHMENNLSPLMKCIFTNRTILSRVYLKRRISANICCQICLS